MFLRQKFITLIIVSVVLFVLFTYFYKNCRNSVNEKIEIFISIDKLNEKMEITYILPPINHDTLLFRFSGRIPGVYFQLAEQLVENFEALDSANNLLPFEKDSLGYCITHATNLKKINYSIIKTEINSNNFMSEGNFITDELIVINGSAALGYVEDLINLPVSIVCTGINKKKCISANYKILNDTAIIINFENYHLLIDNPIIFSSIADSTAFKVDNNKISVYTHSPNHKMTSKTMAHIVKPAVEAIWSELDFIKKNNYRLVFVFNSAIDNDIWDYFGLEHKKSSIYYLLSEPNLADFIDSSKFAFFIKNTVAHEVLHLFVPISFSDNKLSPYSFSNFEMSKHLWLYEGFVEYYSFKTLYKKGVTKQQEFFDEFSRRLLPYFWGSGNFSLAETSENIYYEPWYMPAFYSRGAIFSMLLDIEILDKTNMEKDLFTLLKYIHTQTPIVDVDSLIPNIVRFSEPSIADFFNNYIIGDSCPVFDNYLQKAGLKIEKYKKIIWYSFRINDFEYNHNHNNLVITFAENQEWLENNPVNMISINDIPINSFTFGLLFNRLWSPRKIKTTYIENDLEKTVFIEQKGTERNFMELKLKDTLTTKEQMIFDRLFKN